MSDLEQPIATSEERLPVMLAARWVLGGRTPRQHQERYEAFLDVIDDEFTAAEITVGFDSRTYANKELLPVWLEDVATGREPPAATERLLRREVERVGNRVPDLARRIKSALEQACRAWSHMLQGIVLANAGDIVAIFHEDQLQLGWDLHDLFRTVLPCARLRTREVSWLVGRVPAVLGLFLSERESGLIGLVLEREHTHKFDAETCALFLRNAVTLLGRPELASYVEADLSTVGSELEDRDEPSPALGLPHSGFGTGFRDFGLTRADLLPALQAAWSGREVPAPKRARGRKA
ncbi:hypothetical protein KV557_01035 [Kitasatospora aureofaciens]|uniref:hypothetical protein n=1 Tax=Kitasatospora aureofaciens TaxID=1894 RepID=UPI001C437D47|nr:hypothetical protein [Kitasatospora aureofaciens]MBV6695708.1 hypothetical protein [Kitasatospora aureofaciens]